MAYKFYITGTSSGIGLALAEKALEEGHKVVGYSRRSAVIKHPNYRHFSMDLSSFDEYHKIKFIEEPEFEQLILVNNAGTLGEVKPVGQLNPDQMIHTYNLNLIAPSILCKLFLDHTKSAAMPRMILNISSGAGTYPVSSWSTYCASKSGLNLFTEVMQKDEPSVKCFSVSPGIVDTQMQGEIRRLSKSDFPEVGRFMDYKKQGELASATEVAQKLLHLAQNKEAFPEVKVSLRDISF